MVASFYIKSSGNCRVLKRLLNTQRTDVIMWASIAGKIHHQQTEIGRFAIEVQGED
jgi:hypothetical protein